MGEFTFEGGFNGPGPRMPWDPPPPPATDEEARRDVRKLEDRLGTQERRAAALEGRVHKLEEAQDRRVGALEQRVDGMAQGQAQDADARTAYDELRRDVERLKEIAVTGPLRLERGFLQGVSTNQGATLEITTGSGSQAVELTACELAAGATVWERLSGRGPYVVVQTYNYPIQHQAPVAAPGQENTYQMLPIERSVIVRDRAGTLRIFPTAALTTDKPQRFDFVLLMRKVTSHPAYWHVFTAVLTAIAVVVAAKHGLIALR